MIYDRKKRTVASHDDAIEVSQKTTYLDMNAYTYINSSKTLVLSILRFVQSPCQVPLNKNQIGCLVVDQDQLPISLYLFF